MTRISLRTALLVLCLSSPFLASAREAAKFETRLDWDLFETHDPNDGYFESGCIQAGRELSANVGKVGKDLGIPDGTLSLRSAIFAECQGPTDNCRFVCALLGRSKSADVGFRAAEFGNRKGKDRMALCEQDLAELNKRPGVIYSEILQWLSFSLSKTCKAYSLEIGRN